MIIAPPYYSKDPIDFKEMAWFCGKDYDFFKRLFQQLPGYYKASSQVLRILSEDCNIPVIKELGAKNGFEFDLLYRKKKMGEWHNIFSLSLAHAQ